MSCCFESRSRSNDPAVRGARERSRDLQMGVSISFANLVSSAAGCSAFAFAFDFAWARPGPPNSVVRS